MSRIKSFLRDTGGSTTLEFVLLFPMYIMVLLAAIESGTLMMRNVLLERGVDMAIRDLRLGNNVPQSEEDLIDSICANAAFLHDCDEILRIELVRVDMDTFEMPTTRATCKQVDELTDPVLEYQTGVSHDVMLLRACAVFQPFFPTTGMGMKLEQDELGRYSLTAAAAFVVEPA